MENERIELEKWIDFFHRELMKASKIPFDRFEKTPKQIRSERIKKLKKIYGNDNT